MKQMKKIFFLVAIASFGIFALAGCGTSTENTNTAVTNTATNGNTAGKANTAPTKNEEPSGKILKPGDVSSDKAVTVIELVDSIAADKDGWKGKEVAVTGFVNSTSSSGGYQLVTLNNDRTATQSKSVSCSFKGTDSDTKAVFQTVVEIKGKIRDIQMDGESKRVTLEPCELKK